MDFVIDYLYAAGVDIPTEIIFERFCDADNELDLCAELTNDKIVGQVIDNVWDDPES